VPDGGCAGSVPARLPTGAPTRGAIEDFVTVLLAGRAADVASGRGPNSGARADLHDATHRMAEVHLVHGLGDELVALAPDDVPVASASTPPCGGRSPPTSPASTPARPPSSTPTPTRTAGS
jgi:hypothetical protein